MDRKEIKLVNSKGYQPWIFIARAGAKAEAPVLWPPNVKSWLTGKNPGAGKGWGQEKKEVTEGEMVGWYHWPNGHKCEQTQGYHEGQGSLVCRSSWVAKSWTWLSKWTASSFIVPTSVLHHLSISTTERFPDFPNWVMVTS